MYSDRAILASIVGEGSQLFDQILQSVTKSSQVLQALHFRTGRGDNLSLLRAWEGLTLNSLGSVRIHNAIWRHAGILE